MATVFTHKPDTIDFLYNRDCYFAGTTDKTNINATVQVGSQRRHFKIGAIQQFKLEMPQIIGSMLDEPDIYVSDNSFLNRQPSAYVTYKAIIDGIENNRMAIRGAKNIYDENIDQYNNSITKGANYLSNVKNRRCYVGYPVYVSALMMRAPNGITVRAYYKDHTTIQATSSAPFYGFKETGVHVMNYDIASLAKLAGNEHLKTDNVVKYDVILEGYETVTIDVHDVDNRFPVHNIHWVNQKGGIDSFVFNKRYEVLDEVKAVSYVSNGGYTLQRDIDMGTRSLILGTGLMCYDEYKMLSSIVYSNHIMMILDGERYKMAFTSKNFNMPYEKGTIPNIDLKFEIAERQLVTY